MLGGRQAGGHTCIENDWQCSCLMNGWFVGENCSRCQSTSYPDRERANVDGIMPMNLLLSFCEITFQVLRECCSFCAYLFKVPKRSTQFQHIGLFIQPFSCSPSQLFVQFVTHFQRTKLFVKNGVSAYVYFVIANVHHFFLVSIYISVQKWVESLCIEVLKKYQIIWPPSKPRTKNQESIEKEKLRE